MILRTLLKTGKYSPSTEDKKIIDMDCQVQTSNFSKENNIKKIKEYNKHKSENLYNEWLRKVHETDQLLDQPGRTVDIACNFKEVKDEPLDNIASNRDRDIDEQMDKNMCIYERKNFGLEKSISSLNISSIQKEATSSVEGDRGATSTTKSSTAPQKPPVEPRKDGNEENDGYLGSLGYNTRDPSRQLIYTQFDGGYAIDKWKLCDLGNSRYYAHRVSSRKQSDNVYSNDNQSCTSNEIAYQYPITPLSVPLNHPPRSATYLTDKLPELLPLEDFEEEEKEEEVYERGVYRYTFNQIPDAEGLAEDVLRDFSIATHRKVRGPKNWEFLMRLLADSRSNPNLIKWEDPENYTFRLVQPDIIIDIWNSKSKRPPISYNNFARGLRYHYKRGALMLVREHQMVYGCGPEAISFLNKIMSRQIISHSSSSFFRPWK